MTTFQVPLLVLGGGGYTIRNVARCWTYETGCLLGHELEDKMPVNDYSEYFGPTHTLQIQPSNMENQNTPEYLEGVRNRILENLSKIPPKPSVPFHDVPPDAITQDAMEIKEDPDAKGGGAEAEAARRAHPDGVEPDEGDRDDKPSRHDGAAAEAGAAAGNAEEEKKAAEGKEDGGADAAAVKAEDEKADEKAELGDAAVAEAPENERADAAAEGAAPAPAEGAAMDVDGGGGVVSDLPPRSPAGPGIMASDHGDEQ
jgi:histone deacetylase 1/2